MVAPTKQDKLAWVTDITQCMDNVHFVHYNPMPTIVKSDPSLFKDDVDIKFSRSLNNCKVPLIRYATPERLLHRLTDLRFLSIDFLNTFLLTYRVFADGEKVLEALKTVFYCAGSDGVSPASSSLSLEREGADLTGGPTSSQHLSAGPEDTRRISTCSGYSTGQSVGQTSRRISGASSGSGYASDDSGPVRGQHWRYSFRRCQY